MNYDRDEYQLRLDAERAKRGLSLSFAHIVFDPDKHKRDLTGRFMEMVSDLKPGQTVKIGRGEGFDAVHVSRTKHGYKVHGGGGLHSETADGFGRFKSAKGHRDPEEAIADALERSGHSKHPSSVHGREMKSHTTVTANGKDWDVDPEDGKYHVGGDVVAAADLLAEGHKVKLDQPDQVGLLLDELHDRITKIRKAAEEGGEEAKIPNFNMCDVSVPGTNIFCVKNKGIARIHMPQLSGHPKPGSKGDKLIKSGKIKTNPKDGTIDLTQDFIKHLQDNLGIKITKEQVPVAHLHATQNELNGEKIAGMANAIESGAYKPNTSTLVSSDNYIVDGHHRVAAQVGVDSKDNVLGGLDVPIDRADIDIITLLDEANKYAAMMGIPNAAVTKLSQTVGCEGGSCGIELDPNYRGTQMKLNKSDYELYLAAERAKRGLDLSITFDPSKHRRDLMGRFVEMIQHLQEGQRITLPDGVFVTRRTNASRHDTNIKQFAVGRKIDRAYGRSDHENIGPTHIGGIGPKSDLEAAAEAAVAALDASAQSTHPDSLGGARSHGSMVDAISATNMPSPNQINDAPVGSTLKIRYTDRSNPTMPTHFKAEKTGKDEWRTPSGVIHSNESLDRSVSKLHEAGVTDVADLIHGRSEQDQGFVTADEARFESIIKSIEAESRPAHQSEELRNTMLQEAQKHADRGDQLAESRYRRLADAYGKQSSPSFMPGDSAVVKPLPDSPQEVHDMAGKRVRISGAPDDKGQYPVTISNNYHDTRHGGVPAPDTTMWFEPDELSPAPEHKWTPDENFLDKDDVPDDVPDHLNPSQIAQTILRQIPKDTMIRIGRVKGPAVFLQSGFKDENGKVHRGGVQFRVKGNKTVRILYTGTDSYDVSVWNNKKIEKIYDSSDSGHPVYFDMLPEIIEHGVKVKKTK